MLRTAALILLAVELGGAFGNATATISSTTDQSASVELHVEVEVDADSVVAHLVLPGEPTVSLPMIEETAGLYRITTEIKKANYQVVFEILGATSHQSQPASLAELGATFEGEPGTGTTDAIDDSSPISDETDAWLWLTIAFGAASLSALAIWVLGGKEKETTEEDQTSSEADSVDSE